MGNATFAFLKHEIAPLNKEKAVFQTISRHTKVDKKWGHMKFCYETNSLTLNIMFITKEKKLHKNKKFSDFFRT